MGVGWLLAARRAHDDMVLIGYPDQSGPSIFGAELDTPIEELDLEVSAYHRLKRVGVVTVGELVIRSERDLLDIRNFRAKHVVEVRERLHELGLSLREQ
jgi:DNA-directed RNA polymerase alpha subunit